MKHIAKYSLATLLAAASMMSFSACTNEEDDLFEISAADRLTTAGTKTAEILSAAPNGWAMQYFTNPLESEPGYIYLMNFSTNGSVKIAGNNKWIGGTYQEETSLYDMIADNGPVLSFSSYNTIFHIMATPEDVDATMTSEQGYGHRGDYEFIIMNYNDTKVTLKGKKWGKTCVLTPVPADVTWEQYFDNLAERQSAFFNPIVPCYYLQTPEKTYRLTHADGGYFYVCAEDADPVVDTEYFAYVVTPDGLRLEESFAGNQDFLDDETGALVSTTTGAKIVSPTAIELLTTSYDIMTLVANTDYKVFNPVMSKEGCKFDVSTTEVTGDYATKSNAAITAFINYWYKISRKRDRLKSINLTFDTSKNCLTYNILTGNFSSKPIGFYFTPEVIAENQIRLNLGVTDAETGETLTAVNDNALSFYNSVPELKEFIDYLTTQTLTVQFDKALGSTLVVVSTTDGSTFELSL